MNERIKQLAEQAVKNVDVVHEDNPFNEELAKMYIPNVFIERFAQFLIKDAIAVVNRRFMGDMNREDMEVRRCIEDLKKHFGIE
jgi:hypothetical protein